MKIDRLAVLNKYGGHCAYCGETVTLKTMQVDHIFPKRLSHFQKDADPNRLENLNPACRKCNNFKGGLVVDPHGKYFGSLRHELGKQVDRLRGVSQFDRALRFGLIGITGKPVEFYFEKYEKNQIQAD